MKSTIITLAATLAIISPALAQFSPVLITTVQPIDQKSRPNAAQPSPPPQVGLDESGRLLRIALRNITPQPVKGITMRWAIAKTHRYVWSPDAVTGQLFRFKGGGSPHAVGGQQTLDFDPKEQKVVESDFVPVCEYSYRPGRIAEVTGRSVDEHRFDGHIVQILFSGKVIAENLTGSPALKGCFEQLFRSQSPASASGPTRSVEGTRRVR